jgi:hypothetical protein
MGTHKNARPVSDFVRCFPRFQWLVVEKRGIRSLLEMRSHRRSRVSFDELPELDATTSADIDAALLKADLETLVETAIGSGT